MNSRFYIHIFMCFLTLARNWCRSNVLSGKRCTPRNLIMIQVQIILHRSLERKLMPCLGQVRYNVILGNLFQKARKLIKIKSHVKNLEVSLKGRPMHQSWGIRKNEQLIETHYISESLNPQWYSRKKKTKLTSLFGISMKQIIYCENHWVI